MKKHLRLQFIVSTLLVISFPFFSFSQENNDPATSVNTPLQQEQAVQKRAVLSLNAAIASMISSPSPAKVAEGERLKNLAFDLRPTIYINSGQATNPSGKTPLCVETDVISVSKLYEENVQFSKVELITLKITKNSDLGTILRPELLRSFSSLKYLCISSSFEICTGPGCEAPIVSQMVAETGNSNYLILYQISIPE